MYGNEILHTVQLAHHFQSAFSRHQVWRLLRIKMNRATFDHTVERLIEENQLQEQDGRLFVRDFRNIQFVKQQWSRRIFSRYRFYLRLLSRLPWIRQVGLTGANAFESCREQDDIDLFVITRPNRLWLVYLMAVLFSKMLRKREILCINYLIDENNLEIVHKNYYTAVQLMHMIPLIDDTHLNDKLISANRWVKRHLPNAGSGLVIDPFYLIRNAHKNGNGNGHGKPGKSGRFLDRLNGFIYRKYRNHLYQKYAEAFGRGIILSEGLAKLNRQDYQDIYDRIYRQLKESLAR